jgi:hypothetical protein
MGSYNVSVYCQLNTTKISTLVIRNNNFFKNYVFFSIIFRLGGLDLSRHGLDRDSRSRRFSKVDLDLMDILDGFQKLVSTWRTFSTAQKTKSQHGLCPKISIFVKISIETLDLDTFKSWSQRDGQSRRFSKVSLDTKDVLDLDLDWSRPSRPPSLIIFYVCRTWFVYCHKNMYSLSCKIYSSVLIISSIITVLWMLFLWLSNCSLNEKHLLQIKHPKFFILYHQ